ncbi:SAF domain-containing protein, partial [Ruegeria sp. NA]
MHPVSEIKTPGGPARDTIRLNPDDNVIIALRDLKADAQPDGISIRLPTDIARGHKIATAPIAAGENVIRYGQIIGQAKADIAAGEHVHVHNLGMGAHQQDYAYASANAPLPEISGDRIFQGFHRADGKVGTRNYIGILSTVNCSGSVARF